MNTEKLFLGVSREIITPKIGCNLYGYDPNIYSTSVNDDLTATAFYFKQGDTQALILSVTLCSINNKIANELLESISKEISISRSNIVMHTTHTHSGPNVSGSAGWGNVDESYINEILFPKILKVCKDATKTLTPVKMGVCKGKSLVGVNRRELKDGIIRLGQNKDGVFDSDMTVISFVDENNKSVANFIHYGCHATASGLNTEITRDWPGVMIDDLERVSGGLTAFLNGPEGDVGPRLKSGKTTGDKSVKYALELGEIASKDALNLYKLIDDFYTPKLKANTYQVTLPLEKRISLEDAKLGYEKYKDAIHNIYIAQRAYYERVIKSYDSDYQEVDGAPFNQTIISLGEVAFVAFPHELFAEIGLKIKNEKVYQHTLVLALSNGSDNYFPTSSEMDLGGYEVNMFKIKYVQPFRYDCDNSAIVQTVENLKNLKCKE